MTSLCLVGLIVFGAWATRLPVARGSYFVLWHQLVRIGAALWPKTAPGERDAFLRAVEALAPDWAFDRPADVTRAFAAWC